MKSERLELRAGKDELARWDAAAAELGLTRAAWLRLVANQASQRHGLKLRIAKMTKLAKQAEGIDPLLLWGAWAIGDARPRQRRRKTKKGTP